MSDNSVDVMDIVPLSKDDSDVHMFNSAKVRAYLLYFMLGPT